MTVRGERMRIQWMILVMSFLERPETVNDVHQLVIPAFSLNFFTFQVKDIAPQAISSGQNSRKE
jgi:hypothetical protein